MILKDKVVLITGGNKGLGRAVARKFSEEGAKLILWARDEEKLNNVKNELEGKGTQVIIDQVDMRRLDQIEEKLAAAFKTFPHIDILVNSAGMPLLSGFLQTTEEQFDSVYDVNIKGPFFLTQAVIKKMVDNKRKGSIINISSITGKSGTPQISAYASSKAALISLTQCLSKEFAPSGIRVNAICPGALDTEMFHRDTIGVMAEKYNTSSENLLKSLLSTIPIKRLIDPAEVAELICYISSEKGGAITGQAINICGGLELH